MSEWPKLDPVTKRVICMNCWNGIHYHEWHSRKNSSGKMEGYYVQVPALKGKAEHACSELGCDCIHRSEETWAAIERQTAKNNRIELRKNLQKQLETSPLISVNESFKPKGKKEHA